MMSHPRLLRTALCSAPKLMIWGCLVPAAMYAQTAVVSGSLTGFDVLNHTGGPTHGFEIQIEGALPGDLYYTVPGGRYGNPTVVPYATGVYVRYKSNYVNGVWSATTPVADLTSFSWNNCYSAGYGYATSGCEHFGQYMRPIPAGTVITVTGRWLIEDPNSAGQLIGSDPPAAVPGVTWTIPAPTTTTPTAPIVVAVIPAPVPPPPPAQFSDAHWVKVFKTELPRQVNANELTSDNSSVVPEAPAQVETAWKLLQVAPPGSQNQKGKSSGSHTNSAPLGITSESVIRRYEVYKYSGAYNTLTHEALCADGVCNAPSAGELGAPVSANNAGTNTVADSLTVTKSGSGAGSATVTVGSTTCSSASCANFGTAGTIVALTANPSSTVFAGWTGACSGTQLTCSVTVNGKTATDARFLKVFTLSVGRSNPGTVTATPDGIDRALNCGGTCSAKYADGTSVTLTATPPAGKAFVNWSGGCSAAGTNPVCTVAISSDTSVQAIFSK